MPSTWTFPVSAIPFTPIAACADTDELAGQGKRLLIRFGRRWEPGDPIESKVADMGMLTSGWVIGIARENTEEQLGEAGELGYRNGKFGLENCCPYSDANRGLVDAYLRGWDTGYEEFSRG